MRKFDFKELNQQKPLISSSLFFSFPENDLPITQNNQTQATLIMRIFEKVGFFRAIVF